MHETLYLGGTDWRLPGVHLRRLNKALSASGPTIQMRNNDDRQQY